jgi:hypothetical protein
MVTMGMGMPASRMTSKWVVGRQRLVAVLFCLFLVYCSWLVVRQGLADGIADEALTEITSWNEATLEAVQVHSTLALMLRASELDPGHPTYLHRLGRLSHILMGLELAQRDDWAGHAKDYYRQSLAVRPAWPLSWANLALVKSDLLEFDAEMDIALANATSFGPWEPGVLLIVTRIATTHSQYLSTEIRSTVAANVARGLLSPVKGVAAKIEDMLSHATPNQELVASLEDMLVTSDWNRNPDQLMRIALQYYSLWKPASLDIIRVSLVSEIVTRPHTVRFVSEKKRLLQLCPYLPRKPKFRNACQ